MKKHRYRIEAVILVVAMVALFLFATFFGQEKEDDDITEDIIVLKIWGSVPEEAGPKQMIEDFNQKFFEKGIQAEYCYYQNNEAGNKLLETTILAGGNVDAYFTYTIGRLEKRVRSNMALDLSNRILIDEIDMEKCFGDHVSAYYIDNKPYCIPTKRDQYGITINKDMFDKAGISVPKEWDYDEFREIAKQLTKGSGADKQYGMFFCSQQDITYALTYFLPRSLGGDPLFRSEDDYSNFDNPVVYRLVNLVDTMMNVDHSAPTHIDSVTQKLTQESMFLSGKCAMTIGPWIIRSVKDQKNYPHAFTTAFVPYPVEDKTADNYSQGGLGDYLSIYPNSSHTSEAWEFVKWYAMEGMLPLVEGGRIPAYQEFDVEEMTELLLKDANGSIDEKSAKEVLVSPKDNYAIPSRIESLSKINQIISDELEQILTQDKSVEVGLKDAKKRADEYIDSQN